MPKRFYEIFRAGNYPQGSFDADDIKAIAENYDPSFLEAPVTIDHSFGGPAYGWIEELKAEGERLLATFKDVSDHLKCMVATKSYKRHSIELYNDLEGTDGPYLKALSMLGASAPQVKGMETIQFSEEDYPENESQTIEFDEPIDPGQMELSELFEAWLDVLDMNIEEFRQQCGFDQDTAAGLIEGRFDEDADESLVSEFSDLLRQFGEEDANEATTEQITDFVTDKFSEEEEEDTTSSFEESEEFAEMQARIQKLEDELDTERSAKENFKSKNEQIQFNQRKKDFVSFLDDQVEDGKLLPKLKEKAVSMFAHLDGLQADEEDDKSPLKLFKEIIEGLPEINLEEQAPKGDQSKEFSGSKELAEAATKYMQEQKELGKHVSAAQAVTHVKNQRK